MYSTLTCNRHVVQMPSIKFPCTRPGRRGAGLYCFRPGFHFSSATSEDGASRTYRIGDSSCQRDALHLCLTVQKLLMRELVLGGINVHNTAFNHWLLFVVLLKQWLHDMKQFNVTGASFNVTQTSNIGNVEGHDIYLCRMVWNVSMFYDLCCGRMWNRWFSPG